MCSVYCFVGWIFLVRSVAVIDVFVFTGVAAHCLAGIVVISKLITLLSKKLYLQLWKLMVMSGDKWIISKWFQSILRQYAEICLEGMRKTMKGADRIAHSPAMVWTLGKLIATELKLQSCHVRFSCKRWKLVQ
jgi:hypothetical protein